MLNQDDHRSLEFVGGRGRVTCGVTRRLLFRRSESCRPSPTNVTSNQWTRNWQPAARLASGHFERSNGGLCALGLCALVGLGAQSFSFSWCNAGRPRQTFILQSSKFGSPVAHCCCWALAPSPGPKSTDGSSAALVPATPGMLGTDPGMLGTTHSVPCTTTAKRGRPLPHCRWSPQVSTRSHAQCT